MAIIRWNPFAELQTIHDQINSMFDDAFSGQGASFKQMIPTTDVYQDGKQLVVEAHLPNFNEDEININVQNQALEITAEHRQKQEDTGERKYLLQESASSFYRRIALPKGVDEDSIKADFDNGILKVAVPLKELPGPKKIAIGAGKANGKKNETAK
jgi:HSP20 family protein